MPRVEQNRQDGLLTHGALKGDRFSPDSQPVDRQVRRSFGHGLFRAPVPLTATSNWQGWGGAHAGWINLPTSYPTVPELPPCAPLLAPVLKGMFRFS